MAGQPTPPNVPPPLRNKDFIRLCLCETNRVHEPWSWSRRFLRRKGGTLGGVAPVEVRHEWCFSFQLSCLSLIFLIKNLMEVGGKNIFHLWLKKNGMDWGNKTKCLGKHIWQKNTTKKRLLIKKARLFVCLFVCFQWILAPMDLTFMFEKLWDLGEILRLTGQIFHISWRSWYLHSVALMYRVRDDWGPRRSTVRPWT